MAGETVTRARLSEAVYQEVGLSRNESAGLVESVIEKNLRRSRTWRDCQDFIIREFCRSAEGPTHRP